MIPFDFEYYRPLSLQDAIQLYQSLTSSGKQVSYYSGGTEFITLARLNQITVDAVIDLKGIAECTELTKQAQQVIIGSAVSLNQVAQSDYFPLLGEKIKLIADHTSRNKITLGGNLNSKLIYKEAILPLLVANAKLKITGVEGEIITPVEEVFEQELKLNPGDILVQLIIDEEYIQLPYASVKKTKISSVEYPLVSIAALIKDKQIRTAFSGLCPFPFHSPELNELLSQHSLSKEDRVEQALSLLPAPILHDWQGSAEYRQFVFRHALIETMEILEMS